jgi:uncharacterized membrane protein
MEDVLGLPVMILGLVLFLGVHLLTTQRDLRARFVASLGEGGYKLCYALVSFKHVTEALMLPAVILAVAAYIRGRIYATLKHPLLAAVKLWAAAHLLANGDLGSIILFGSFLAWAVVDRISLKRRADPGAPPIPVGGPGNDAIAIALGIAAYLALGFVFHPVVIGVPVFGA